jgi:hypothetical protein
VNHKVLGDDLVGDSEVAVPQVFHCAASAVSASLDMAVLPFPAA